MQSCPYDSYTGERSVDSCSPIKSELDVQLWFNYLLFWFFHLTSWGRTTDSFTTTRPCYRFKVRSRKDRWVSSWLYISLRNITCRENFSFKTGNRFSTGSRTLFLWAGSVIIALCYICIQILVSSSLHWEYIWIIKSSTSMIDFSLVYQTMAIFTQNQIVVWKLILEYIGKFLGRNWKTHPIVNFRI